MILFLVLLSLTIAVTALWLADKAFMDTLGWGRTLALLQARISELESTIAEKEKQ